MANIWCMLYQALSTHVHIETQSHDFNLSRFRCYQLDHRGDLAIERTRILRCVINSGIVSRLASYIDSRNWNTRSILSYHLTKNIKIPVISVAVYGRNNYPQTGGSLTGERANASDCCMFLQTLPTCLPIMGLCNRLT